MATQQASPEIVRYLRALSVMTRDIDPAVRKYAREVLRDLGEPGLFVTDYLRPVMTLPLHQLQGPERRLRLIASATQADLAQSFPEFRP